MDKKVKFAPIYLLFQVCLFVLLSISIAYAEKDLALTGDTLENMAELNFQVMGIQQNLPHSSVYGFAQDTSNYLWIATFGGLVRYDGLQFHTYVHTEDPHSLPDNNVRLLLPSPNGNLWVGTGSAGVVRYEAATDTFSTPLATPDVLRHSRIFCMNDDGHGGVWFGTQYGLAHLIHTGKEEHFELFGKYAVTQQDGLPSVSVFSLLVDRDQTLWVGTETGLYRHDAGSSKFVPVLSLSGAAELGTQASIWSLFQDHSGIIWVGTNVTGIGKVDADRQTIHGLAGFAGANSPVASHTIRGFVEVEPGVLWIATYGGGLFRFDNNRHTVRHWVRDQTASAPLSNDFIRGIFQDSSGVLWLGTDNGLSRTNVQARGIFNIHSSPLRPNQLFGAEIRSVGAGNGHVLVGFDQGGFAVIDPDGSIHKINPASGVAPQRFSHREVLSIKPLDQHTAIAGGVGLYTIDLANRTYRPVENSFLSQQVINAMCVEGDVIWTGTYSGLVRYNRRTHEMHLFSHDVRNSETLADNYVRDILKAHDGRLWITTRLGLDLLDESTGTFRHFRHITGDPQSLGSDNVQPIAEDREGHLWIGTIGAGLTILDAWTAKGEPRFRHLGTKEHLPDDVVLTITHGKDGRMWVNTPRGLASVDSYSLKVESYSVADGLQPSAQNLFSSATLEDGTILFPGDSSLVIVRPERLTRWTYRAPLVVTNVDLPDDDTSSVVLARSMQAGQLTLPSHGGLQADFALLDFTSPENTKYSYKLEGFDRDWTESDTTRRSATYTNLPPATYRLLVRATSRAGSGPTVELDVPIHVRPYWYETVWAHVFELGLSVLFILGLVRLRTNYLHRQQQILEAEIAERTSELEEKRLELMRVNKRLGELALHDPLTGILNRRGFTEQAELELARSRRSKREFALMLADLDDFKVINDTLSHAAGDLVLKTVSQLLVTNLRPTDLVGRYGGEELIILLPETPRETAMLLAERLRKLVADLKLTHEGKPIPITLSIGVSFSHGKEDLQTLIATADRGLYVAKAEGKNRVCTIHSST